MKIYETQKFKRLREKLKNNIEKEALKNAVVEVANNPLTCKKLKGELKDMRCYKYNVDGQERRLIFKVEGDALYFVSFGPPEGIYK